MDWQEEFFGLWFRDQRLTKRFFAVLQSFSERPGDTIAGACKTWAHTKATYRLLASPDFNGYQVMELHRQKTIERMQGHEVVLALSDTSLLNYQEHFAVEDLGSIGRTQKGAKTTRGLITHNLIAITPDLVPLGLLDQATWSRKSKKGKPCEEEKESGKWVKSLLAGSLKAQKALGSRTRVITVSDRESDINEYLEAAYESGVDVIVRARTNRVDELTEKPLRESIENDFSSLGSYDIEVKHRYYAQGNNYKRKARRLEEPEIEKVKCEVRAGPVMIKDPKSGACVPMTCVHVKAIPRDQKPTKKEKDLDWILLTTLEASTFESAKQIIDYYKARWFIEVFFRTLKTGCGVEKSRLETAERLKNYLLMMSIVAIKICMMTYTQRTTPEKSCEEILSPTEWQALYLYYHPNMKLPKTPPTIGEATVWIAQLGGFLARKSDGYPGTIRMWKGMLHLADIHEAYIRFVTKKYG